MYCLLPYIFGTMEILFCISVVFSTILNYSVSIMSYHFLWEMQRHTKTSIYNFQINRNIFLWCFFIKPFLFWKQYILCSWFSLSVCMNDIYLLRMPEITVNVSVAFTMTGILQNLSLFCRYICNCLAFDCACCLACIFSSKEASRWYWAVKHVMCKETLRNWVYFVLRQLKGDMNAVLNFLMNTYRRDESRFFVDMHINSTRCNECMLQYIVRNVRGCWWFGFLQLKHLPVTTGFQETFSKLFGKILRTQLGKNPSNLLYVVSALCRQRSPRSFKPKLFCESGINSKIGIPLPIWLSVCNSIEAQREENGSAHHRNHWLEHSVKT